MGYARLMEALQVLVDRVRESGVFKRNRTPLEVKVLAAMLCFAGLSYRRAAGLLGCLSYMAVQRAFIALKDAFPRGGVGGA